MGGPEEGVGRVAAAGGCREYLLDRRMPPPHSIHHITSPTGEKGKIRLGYERGRQTNHPCEHTATWRCQAFPPLPTWPPIVPSAAPRAAARFAGYAGHSPRGARKENTTKTKSILTGWVGARVGGGPCVASMLRRPKLQMDWGGVRWRDTPHRAPVAGVRHAAVRETSPSPTLPAIVATTTTPWKDDKVCRGLNPCMGVKECRQLMHAPASDRQRPPPPPPWESPRQGPTSERENNVGATGGRGTSDERAS